MALSIYLAMTAWETANYPLPENYGWMACHFSAYGIGLSNIPKNLPKGSVLILNDRIPPSGHDPALISEQVCKTVQAFHCRGVLLDFQRPYHWQTAQICSAIHAAVPCPLAITAQYADKFDCSVFLPPVPPCVSLCSHLSPWTGRDIWLEIDDGAADIILTEDGCGISPESHYASSSDFYEASLHCHYSTKLLENKAVFSLKRTPEDIAQLLNEAEELGVSLCIGLYQQLQDVLIVRNNT